MGLKEYKKNKTKQNPNKFLTYLQAAWNCWVK